MNFNQLRISTVLILLVFSVKYSFAQRFGMGGFGMHGTGMNQTAEYQHQMKTQMRMGIMRNVWSSVLQYDFHVLMRDSSQKEISSAIYTNRINHKRFIIMIDSAFGELDTNRYKPLYPSQTLSVIRSYIDRYRLTDENAPIKHMYGAPNDTCWMFNVQSGAISLYASLCNIDYEIKNIVGIQLNDSPIIAFNQENLKKIILQDKESIKEFDKKRWFRAIDVYNKDIENGQK
jgi:hypothetical protein